MVALVWGVVTFKNAGNKKALADNLCRETLNRGGAIYTPLFTVYPFSWGGTCENSPWLLSIMYRLTEKLNICSVLHCGMLDEWQICGVRQSDLLSFEDHSRASQICETINIDTCTLQRSVLCHVFAFIEWFQGKDCIVSW